MNNFINSCRVGFLEYLLQQSDIVALCAEASRYWETLPEEWATDAYRDSITEDKQERFDRLSHNEQERIAFDCAMEGFDSAFIEWQNFTYPA